MDTVVVGGNAAHVVVHSGQHLTEQKNNKTKVPYGALTFYFGTGMGSLVTSTPAKILAVSEIPGRRSASSSGGCYYTPALALLNLF